MFKTVLDGVVYTILNIRYSALILPTAAVALALHFSSWLAVAALVLLVLAVIAELALSVHNGVEAAKAIRLEKQRELEQQAWMDRYLDRVEKHANDWTGSGSEDQGEAPDEGQAPVPARI